MARYLHRAFARIARGFGSRAEWAAYAESDRW